MRLTEFIEANHESITREWVEFAGTLLPWAEGMDDKALKDHAEEILRAVVADMQSPQTILQQSSKSRGDNQEGALARVGQKHASDRMETGISLEQLVSEFRALRASVLRQWEKKVGDPSGDVTRFNEAIDETLAESTARYSATVSSTRDQFLGILSHDLRNPLGAIMMGASLLSDTDDPDQLEIAKTILSSAERMSRMVNDLLDLTRSGLGTGIPVSFRTTDLGEICKLVVAELHAMHPKVDLKFETKDSLLGMWDGDRLAQVLSNLSADCPFERVVWLRT